MIHHVVFSIIGIAVLSLELFHLPLAAFGQTKTDASAMKIGIIGAGNIGGTVGTLWVKAGHPVLFSSRHPEELKTLVDKLGPLARAGTVRESFGVRRGHSNRGALWCLSADWQGLRPRVSR